MAYAFLYAKKDTYEATFLKARKVDGALEFGADASARQGRHMQHHFCVPCPPEYAAERDVPVSEDMRVALHACFLSAGSVGTT
eukprot:8500805-Pyramimonas_sp.AAC.1